MKDSCYSIQLKLLIWQNYIQTFVVTISAASSGLLFGKLIEIFQKAMTTVVSSAMLPLFSLEKNRECIHVCVKSSERWKLCGYGLKDPGSHCCAFRTSYGQALG